MARRYRSRRIPRHSDTCYYLCITIFGWLRCSRLARKKHLRIKLCMKHIARCLCQKWRAVCSVFSYTITSAIQCDSLLRTSFMTRSVLRGLHEILYIAATCILYQLAAAASDKNPCLRIPKSRHMLCSLKYNCGQVQALGEDLCVPIKTSSLPTGTKKGTCSLPHVNGSESLLGHGPCRFFKANINNTPKKEVKNL